MPQFLSALFILTFFSGSFTFAEVLRVNVYDLPPHIFTLNEEPEGPGITFFKDYVKLPNTEVRWVATPFARVLWDMQNKKVDVALFLVPSPEREKYMRFSKTPLFTTSSAIIIPRNSPLTRATSLKDFRGRTLGHSKDSFTPTELLKHGIKIEPLSGENVIERNLQKIRAKRLDGIFIPTASNGEYILRKLRVDDQYQVFVVPDTTLNLHVAFRKDIDEKTYQMVEAALKKNQRIYRKLLDQQLSK
ncbi:transporter substrate-binding domain-containing protein [Bdellovibrio bacteriovorus]|uniref:Probable amino-acid ABC transporter n=1 Tax=Bdellovibrio bacteriovorus (strain ATCC 15356 / DSM 50701 / NCIMB 9529 / HD100) TaxID=264462 RepID=Q6MNL1_BDEBA|nr:transporter substrate-binding domain-containing protein [Bdellovibrio bacteriovorus]CAE79140.1 probable amino-acid ABC transporter [Bdellovibrio bacteriovorus HD100]